MLDAELVADEAVFERRGGGGGGGTLERDDWADAWGLSSSSGSVWVREMDGDGSRSTSESILAVDAPRGGSGGTAFRRIGSWEDWRVSVRSDDGLLGLVGGIRGFTGGLGFAISVVSSSPRSIKSPTGTFFTSLSGGVGTGRRGGRLGLLGGESKDSTSCGELQLRASSPSK